MLFKNVFYVIMIVVLFAVIGCENHESENKMPIDGQVFVFRHDQTATIHSVYFENKQFILGKSFNPWKIVQSQYDPDNHIVVITIGLDRSLDTTATTFTYVAYEATGITKKDFVIPNIYASYDDYSGLFATSYSSGSTLDSMHIVAIDQLRGFVKILKFSSLIIEEPRFLNIFSNENIPGSVKAVFDMKNGEQWELSRWPGHLRYTPQRTGIVSLKRSYMTSYCELYAIY